MAVVSVTYKKIPTKSTRLQSNKIVTEYKAIYSIVTDDNSSVPIDGPDTIIDQAIAGAPTGRRLPAIRDAYQYGSEINLLAPCVSHGELTRSAASKSRYTIEVTWSDDTSNDNGGGDGEDPETIYQRVEIDFQEQQVPGSQFRYLGANDQDGKRFGMWPDVPENGEAHDPLQDLALTPGSIGPVRNSAGAPKLRNVRRYRHILRVTNFAAAWDPSFRDALNGQNTASVRIVEINDVNILFDETYPPYTLKILNVDKRTVEYFGTNIVEITWILEFDPDQFIVREIDSGTQALFIEGAKDPALAKIDPVASEIEAADERLQENRSGFRDLNVSSEIMLNGEGVERRFGNRPGVDGPIVLNFIDASAPALDFNTLPVSASFTPAIASVLPAARKVSDGKQV